MTINNGEEWKGQHLWCTRFCFGAEVQWVPRSTRFSLPSTVLCSHKDPISIHSFLSNSRNGGRSYVLGIKILCLFPLPNLVSHSLTSLKIILSHQIILLKNGSMQGKHKYPKEHQKPIKFTSLLELIFHKLFNFPLSMVFIYK